MHITGLDPADVVMCDLLWGCDSAAAVDALIHSMSPQHQARAQVLRELMTAHAYDAVDHVSAELEAYLATL